MSTMYYYAILLTRERAPKWRRIWNGQHQFIIWLLDHISVLMGPHLRRYMGMIRRKYTNKGPHSKVRDHISVAIRRRMWSIYSINLGKMTQNIDLGDHIVFSIRKECGPTLGRFNKFLKCPIKLCWAFFCSCRHAKINIWPHSTVFTEQEKCCARSKSEPNFQKRPKDGTSMCQTVMGVTGSKTSPRHLNFTK